MYDWCKEVVSWLNQTAFLLLSSDVLGQQNKLTDLETLALLIAALSHDLDHRGVNNSYIQR